MDERREVVEIDLSAVTTPGELHTILARSLGFPDFYGRNWAAFWDAITGLVEMPRRLRLVGWAGFAVRLPDAGSAAARVPGRRGLSVPTVVCGG